MPDLKTSPLDTPGPLLAPRHREQSRDDGRAFDLFLREEVGLSAEGRTRDKPRLADRRVSEGDTSDAMDRRVEAPEGHGQDQDRPRVTSAADAVETAGATERAGTSAAEHRDVEPLAGQDGGPAADDSTGAEGSIAAPQAADALASRLETIANATEAMPPGEHASGAESLATTSMPDRPSAPATSADELAASLGLFIAPPGTTQNPVQPATMPNAAGAVVAAAPAHLRAAFASIASGSGGPPGGGQSTPMQADSAGTPAETLENAAPIPAAVTLDADASPDEQSRQQDTPKDAFRDPSVAAGAPAAQKPTSAAAGADEAAAPGRPAYEQIAVHIARGVKDGRRHLHIALEPDSLGRLEIRLDFHRDGRLNAAIVADRPETLDLLRNEAHALEKSLNAAGFKASPDSLSFDLSSSNERAPPFLTSQGRQTSDMGEDSINEVMAPISPVWRPVLPGRLDIRA